MTSSNSYLGTYEAHLMAALSGGISTRSGGTRVCDIDMTVKTAPVPKGCRKYTFPGFECVASNQKSADRKYQNHLKEKI